MKKHVDLRNRTPQPLYFDRDRDSAVLIPLVGDEDHCSILFERRASDLKHQPDEICFPGGRCEKGETHEQAALRETCEELLVLSENIEIFGPLDYFISYAGLRVMPFLGRLRSYSGTFSQDEVAEIIQIPLRFFAENKPEKYEGEISVKLGDDFPFDRIPGGKAYPFAKGKQVMPFYDYNGFTIWGLTARILSENIPLIMSVFA